MLTTFCLFFILIISFSPCFSYLCKFTVFYLVFCAVSLCLYLLCIYSRFLVCGYREAYIRYLEAYIFRENSIKTCTLSRVKQITSPGWIHETSARAGCTGKTQRNWVEREVGGGIGMGNTCKSMADSCQCMTKTTTICKVIGLQLIKINGKK